MIYIDLLFQTLLYGLGFVLAFHTIYLLFFSVAGHFLPKKEIEERNCNVRSVCVLIPAYKEDAVILESAQAALNHDYAGDFRVVVIADQLQPTTLARLAQMGADVVEVHFEKSTKGKALKLAINALPVDAYSIAVILDADNIMGNGFLSQVNAAFEEGFRVVQGHRTAKNMNTAFALLDACNEEINNHIFRTGHRALGMSAALIGSGMAFDFEYLKQLLTDIGETAGEDKEIDIRILRDKETIHYLQHGWVYDEKVSSAQVFTKQRTRWISTQMELVKNYLPKAVYQLLVNGNICFFDKMVQSLLLPRILLMGVLTVMAGIGWLLPWGPAPMFWVALHLLTGLALLVALPKRLYTRQLWRAVLNLPLAFFAMAIALIKSRRAGNTFIHTPHTSTSNIKL